MLSILWSSSSFPSSSSLPLFLSSSSALFLLAVTIMFVIWKEALDVVPLYMEYQTARCPLFEMSMDYGISFMFAPVAVFFCLLSGLLFLLIGRSVQSQCR